MGKRLNAATDAIVIHFDARQGELTCSQSASTFFARRLHTQPHVELGAIVEVVAHSMSELRETLSRLLHVAERDMLITRVSTLSLSLVYCIVECTVHVCVCGVVYRQKTQNMQMCPICSRWTRARGGRAPSRTRATWSTSSTTR